MVSAAERGDFLTEQIPYPELYAEARDATRRELLQDLWERPGGRRIGRVNVTTLDTFRLQGDPEAAIYARLGVTPEELANPDSPETKRVIERINLALEQAHAYLTGYLGLQLPASLKKVPKVKFLADLVALLEKTALFGEETKLKLAEHAAHCDLLSVALATFELQKSESLALEDELRYVEDLFTRRTEENNQMPLFIPTSAGEEGSRTFKLRGFDDSRIVLSFREKSATSQITKFLMKPEASAREALKDAIGIRIEAPHARVAEVLEAVLPFLVDHFEAERITIENVNLLTSQQLAELEESMRTGPASNVTEVEPPDANPKSAANFQTLKMLVAARIPERGVAGNMGLERMMEIQIIPDDHKNESGLRNHNVYDLKKKIDVMTRLHGGAKLDWIEKQARSIPSVGGPKWERILRELERSGAIIKLPGKRTMYGSASVYRRWYQAGLLPKALRPKVAHALGITETPEESNEA